MNELLEQFLVETRELVQSATDDLLALEAAPEDAEAVNRAFRAFHTLKGSVGLFDYSPWFALLHAAEDGLSAARAGTLAVDAVLIDLSLETLDATTRWADAIETTGRLPDAATAEGTTLAGRYRALLARGTKSSTGGRTERPDWAERLVATPRAAAAGGTLTAVRYHPRGDCFFSGDDPLGLVRKVPGLLTLSVEAAAPWFAAEEFDVYDCNLVVTLLSDAPRAEVDAIFQLVADQVTTLEISAASVEESASGKTRTVDAAGPAMGPVAAAVLAEQVKVLATPADADTVAGRSEACARAAANVLRSDGRQEDADRFGQVLQRSPDAVRELIEVILAGSVTAVGSVVPAKAYEASEIREETTSGEARTLRVDSVRVDAVVALVGELVVARNALSHVADRAAAGEDPLSVVRAIRDADATIGRLATAVHRSAVSLRLTPLSQVFRRFARPVREAARNLGREIELDVRGEDTEADKAVVDSLFEPLLHVVRNAVDHGLEDAGTRRRAGKPAAGRIRILAEPDADGILVSVSDDGRGIDPAFIRRRAIERGLRSAEAAAALDDAAVTDLIFAPGFSTSESVSALSGRGVGMDVVRAAAERMGGQVSVESRVGHGTTVRLHLPQAVALARLMVVESGGDPYGVAMDGVSEVVRRPRSGIHAVDGGAATVLRGRTLPVFPLADLLGYRDRSVLARQATEALLLVVRAGGESVALEVDRLADRIDAVVRPPSGLVGAVPGVSGTTILGDGGVLLVLDPTALLSEVLIGEGRGPGTKP
ncbi:chemotaxis protein CheA [Methylobacterium nigriterrae]|uniref:chemotaxis protein CheA n=1 Tax=Methylobacterium nigriterrae TaxID=3127512 RepID=UPI003013EA07